MNKIMLNNDPVKFLDKQNVIKDEYMYLNYRTELFISCTVFHFLRKKYFYVLV